MSKQGGLARSLGLWAIVGLGLGYMTPTVLFDTFGIVTKETNGVVPLTYLMALVVMLFTAISYGRMAKVFPTAGPEELLDRLRGLEGNALALECLYAAFNALKVKF